MGSLDYFLHEVLLELNKYCECHIITEKYIHWEMLICLTVDFRAVGIAFSVPFFSFVGFSRKMILDIWIIFDKYKVTYERN